MRVYITNLNGQAMQSTAQIAQNMVTDIAVNLGFRELAVFAYPMNTDSPEELSKRLDGIMAGIRPGDIVIFQSPTWNTTAFDVKVMDKLKIYDIKIAIFIHDVVPLMFKEGNFYLMPYTIDYYNKADLIVAPSQAMIDELRQQGLTVEKTLIQGMWDHPTNIPLNDATFNQKIHFPGSPDRFSFVKNWSYDIPLHLYTTQTDELPQNVFKEDWRSDPQLLMDLSKGGFGLVWMDDKDKDYQKLYCPYKLGTYVAAGIPVFVQRGIANQDIVEKNRLGYIVDSLDEMIEIIKQISSEDYYQLVRNVRRFNPLVREGYFTRKLLTDTVFHLLSE